KFRKWVEEGAEYESHWAYMPVRRPALPEVVNKQLIRNPIDAFIQARLARENLTPSVEADRRTLLRRVFLDLTGLPPTPQETQAFVADTAPDAYEKAVDRLLASPRYAEKQTLYWLDAVRYADTCGFHGDNPFPAWPYRDYVLRSFRDNKPFDQFTREQLAGDLLPDGSVETRVASAYNRLNRTSAEGGIQPKEYLAKYAADRVRTTSTVWLGTTIGCAECHDHKFDPLLARDFYSMKAFFADIKETGLVPDRGPLAWGSQLTMPDEAQKQQLASLEAAIRTARGELADAAAKLVDRRVEWEASLLARYNAGELDWMVQRPQSAKSANGATLTIYNDEPVDSYYDFRGSLVPARKPGNGLIAATGKAPDNDTYTITWKPGPGTWTAIGLEVIMDESLPGIRIARGSDRLVLTGVEVEVANSPAPLALATANSTFAVADLAPAWLLDNDPKTGWGLSSYGESRNPFLALRFAQKLQTAADTALTIRLRHDSEYRKATLGRFRFWMSAVEHAWPGSEITGASDPQAPHNGVPASVVAALRKEASARDAEQQEVIESFFRWSQPDLTAQHARLAQLEAQLGLLESVIPRVVVTEAAKPEVTRILPRGNFLDDSGDIVEPAIPQVFGKVNANGRATRLDLAQWLTSPENPLTPRVFANRTWKQFFGTGLSKVLDDLGSQGEWPVHLELLDWLAAEFMQPGAANAHAWDVKHLIRTIVTSHTYRQSSASNAVIDAKDPDNRLLARQSRYRVDAELVRDIALAASGLLSEKFGGPSVRPPQPEGYLAALNFPKREWSASKGDDLYRRGLYTRWQRTFLHPSLAAFDAPTREECTVTRVISNTPLQALVLLNDPVYVEASRVLAQRALTEGGKTFQTQMAWAFARSLNREPNAEERKILQALHLKSTLRFKRDPRSAKEFLATGEAPLPARVGAAELAAMSTVTRAILNLHEVITRN
ncbi:MAG: DUF1553 domain-containing protein, partial [Bryobacterales bacterium]|nr:DUF1553 domain-containing protein [Bryobacterales bacterium]